MIEFDDCSALTLTCFLRLCVKTMPLEDKHYNNCFNPLKSALGFDNDSVQTTLFFIRFFLVFATCQYTQFATKDKT